MHFKTCIDSIWFYENGFEMSIVFRWNSSFNLFRSIFSHFVSVSIVIFNNLSVTVLKWNHFIQVNRWLKWIYKEKTWTKKKINFAAVHDPRCIEMKAIFQFEKTFNQQTGKCGVLSKWAICCTLNIKTGTSMVFYLFITSLLTCAMCDVWVKLENINGKTNMRNAKQNQINSAGPLVKYPVSSIHSCYFSLLLILISPRR